MQTTKNRRRYLKTAVPWDEYPALCQRADAEGLTLSAYLRLAVARDADRLSFSQMMQALREALPEPRTGIDAELEPVLLELLELTRLIASAVNPQAAARASAAINHRFPKD